jgi:hypothetical protein
VAAADYYGALCRLESRLGIAPGGRLLTTYKKLGTEAQRDYTSAGANLDLLLSLGLLSKFQRGSGDGPRARNRRASEVVRRVPIPNPPVLPDRGAITKGGLPRPDIDRPSPPRIDRVPPPNIGRRESADGRVFLPWGGLMDRER